MKSQRQSRSEFITLSARESEAMLASAALSRIKTKRARERKRKHAVEYRKFGRWVRRIRKALGMNQLQFCRRLAVSEITLRRWECGHGHWPSHSNYLQLQKLHSYAKSLKAA